MAITKINASPSVALVGQKVQLAPVGSYSSALELRWYLYSAPADDGKTITLSNYAALGKKREDARLTPNAGGATFAPTSSGRYDLLVYPTTLYRFRRGYAGAVPAAGQSAELDNEEDALPAYAGGTAAAIPVGASSGVPLAFWVTEEASRTFKAASDDLKVKIRFYDNQVISDAEGLMLAADPLALVPGNTADAKAAASDPDVLVVADAMAASADIVGDLPMTKAHIEAAITAWNTHCGLDGSALVHGAPDATNVLALSDPTDLTTAIACIGEVRTKYNAHRILTAGTVHDAADVTNVPSVATATDLASAIVVWRSVWDNLNAHMSDATAHGSDPTRTVDGAAMERVEDPATLAMLLVRTIALRDLYEEHRIKEITVAPHANPDADNVVNVVIKDSDSLINAVQLWSAAVARHVNNRAADNTAAAAPYHQAGSVDVVTTFAFPFGATNEESAYQLAELVLAVFEAHALDGAPATNPLHGSKALGLRAPYTSTSSLCYRMTKAWRNALRSLTPLVVPNTSSASATLHRVYGWTLRAGAGVAALALRKRDALVGPGASAIATRRVFLAYRGDATVLHRSLVAETAERDADLTDRMSATALARTDLADGADGRDAIGRPLLGTARRELRIGADRRGARVARGVERPGAGAEVVRALGRSASRAGPAAHPSGPRLATIASATSRPARGACGASLTGSPAGSAHAAVARLVARAIGLAGLAALAPCRSDAGDRLAGRAHGRTAGPRGASVAALPRHCPALALASAAPGAGTCLATGPRLRAASPSGSGLRAPGRAGLARGASTGRGLSGRRLGVRRGAGGEGKQG
jgi:hypothetical protein